MDSHYPKLSLIIGISYTMLIQFASVLLGSDQIDKRDFAAQLKCPPSIVAGQPFVLTIGMASNKSRWIIDEIDTDKTWGLQVADADGNEINNGHFHLDSELKPKIVCIKPQYIRDIYICPESCSWSPFFKRPGEYSFVLTYRSRRWEQLMHAKSKFILEDFQVKCSVRVDYPDVQAMVASMEQALADKDYQKLDDIAIRAESLSSAEIRAFFLENFAFFCEISEVSSLVLRAYVNISAYGSIEDLDHLEKHKGQINNTRAISLFGQLLQDLRRKITGTRS